MTPNQSKFSASMISWVSNGEPQHRSHAGSSLRIALQTLETARHSPGSLLVDSVLALVADPGQGGSERGQRDGEEHQKVRPGLRKCAERVEKGDEDRKPEQQEHGRRETRAFTSHAANGASVVDDLIVHPGVNQKLSEALRNRKSPLVEPDFQVARPQGRDQAPDHVS